MTAQAGDTAPGASLAASLNTQTNMAVPDDFYEEVIAMHRDLSAGQSALVNAKLILLLANHIGDLAVLREAMRAAREDVGPEPDARDAAPSPHDIE